MAAVVDNLVYPDTPLTVPTHSSLADPCRGSAGVTGPDACVCVYLLHGIHGGVQLLPFGQLLREEQEQEAFPWGWLRTRHGHGGTVLHPALVTHRP